MKIAVCVKRVPDTEARIRIDAGGAAIDEGGVSFVLNPYDEYAVEAALQLREAQGGEVVAISLGPDASQETLRRALAMGADRALLLRAEGVPVDPLPVATLLADELRDGGFDLVLCGKLAIDDGSHAVGPMVAELLGLPCAGAVVELEVAAGRGRAKREVEGGVESVEFALPAVVTTEKGLNQPRLPGLRGIAMAKRKPLQVKDVAPDPGGVEVVGLTLPPERRDGRVLGHGVEAVPALIEALRREAKVL